MQAKTGWRVLGMLVLPLVVQAEVGMLQAGRDAYAGRGFTIRLTGGQITEFTAVVQETTRKLYDVTGETWKQDRANRFDLNDFNVDGAHPVVGLSLQRNGKYVTFHLDGSYLSLSSEAVARRDYYLSVDSITYDGVTYDHMMIPEGSSFSFDVDGATLEMRLQVTPLTFRPVPQLALLPFLDAGLFGFVGQYDIDAGTSRGIKEYQNPIEEFVIGGKVDGISGLGVPEVGAGLECRLGGQEGPQLVLSGRYSVFEYDGGTAMFTSSEHREKNLDIEHENLWLRLMAEFPLSDGRSWMLGAQYQQVKSDGLVESASTDPDEILARRERFDKEFSFRLTQVHGMIGFTF